MYDLEYQCKYQNFLNESDELVNMMYQADLLTIFNKNDYDDVIINEISNLYDKVKNKEEFIKLLRLIITNLEKTIPIFLMTNNGEVDLEYGFICLFSFEYFCNFHPIMQKFLKNEDYTEELTSFNNLLKNNKPCI